MKAIQIADRSGLGSTRIKGASKGFASGFTMGSERVKTLTERADRRDVYRFFDLEFSIRSDSERVLSVFRDIFKRFLIKERTTGTAYYILSKGDGSGPASVIVDDKVYTVEEQQDLVGYSYLKIMNSALSRVDSHHLIHAAALSCNGVGIMLPAASGSGKTTLTLELIKRGFDFLSDDVTAIAKSDHRLHPFPKGIGILPSTLELCPETELDSLRHLPMIGGGVKKLLDIGDMYPERTGRACQAKYLVFLGSQPSTEKFMTGGRLYCVVSSINNNLLSDLREIKGVKDLSVHPYTRYPVVSFVLNGKGFSPCRVEEVCRVHKVILFHTSDGKAEKPDFKDAPRLKKIAKSAALIELLKRVKGAFHVNLSRHDDAGKVTGLFMDLGRFLEGVECFYLTPGRLKESADEICAMVNHSAR